MAITASGLFTGTWKQALSSGGITMQLDLETGKGFLVDDDVSTPAAFTATSSGYTTLSTDEVSGGSWTAGGLLLTTTVLDIATLTGTLVFDADNVSQTTTTISNAMGYVYYLDPLSNNDNVFLVDFVTAVSTSNGTFEIIWAAPGSGGIFNIDMTP